MDIGEKLNNVEKLVFRAFHTGFLIHARLRWQAMDKTGHNRGHKGNMASLIRWILEFFK